MRKILVFLSIVMVLSSCSKEEDIAFIPSLSDTISLNYSHDLTGIYKGTISKVSITKSPQTGEILISYLGPSLNHEIVVGNIDFSFIAIDDISKLEDIGTESGIQRIDTDAFLSFEEGSMDSTLSPINIYSIQYTTRVDSFNGYWTGADSTLVYFIRQTIGNNASDYFFEGTKL